MYFVDIIYAGVFLSSQHSWPPGPPLTSSFSQPPGIPRPTGRPAGRRSSKAAAGAGPEEPQAARRSPRARGARELHLPMESTWATEAEYQKEFGEATKSLVFFGPGR